MSREGFVSDYTLEEQERLALPGCRCSVQQLELVGCDCGLSDPEAASRDLSYANGRTRAEAKASLEAVRHTSDGAYTAAHAFDNRARHWAFADTVLADLGYEVAFYGDTGGHGFAVSMCGLYLSTNSFARWVPDVAALHADYAARGFLGKRLS